MHTTSKSLNETSPFGSLQPTGGRVTSPLILSRVPIEPLEAASRGYINSALSSLNAGSILSGVFDVARLPAFIGDVASAIGTNVLTLSNTGIIAGSYTKVTVDSKGRVIGVDSLTTDDIPSFSWNKITSGKPTTLAGYGITDAVSLNGGTVNGSLTVQGGVTNGLHAATKGYVDAIATSGTNYSTGDIITKFDSTIPSGFLRCNGAVLSKVTYASLYAIVGDGNNLETQPGNGQPWRQQYQINPDQMSDITGWNTDGSIALASGYSQAIVTKNRAYLFGGYNGTTYYNNVYSAVINSDGSIGTWVAGTALPGNSAYAQAFVTKNRVYLVGGHNGTTWSAIVYTAPINADGTIGTWTTGNALPVPIANSQVIVTKSRVYLLAGNVNGTWGSAVYSVPINADGTITTWSLGTALPGILGHSSVVVTKNRVYLLGGYNGTAYVSTVYTAPINTDGTLGTWTTGTALPTTIGHSVPVVTKNRVYLLGGLINGAWSAAVYTAPINADGTLGTWTTGTSLSVSLGFSQSVVTKNKVYMLGGYASASAYSTTSISATILGGLNDYTPYYDGTLTFNDVNTFTLPYYALSETSTKYYFIKY